MNLPLSHQRRRLLKALGIGGAGSAVTLLGACANMDVEQALTEELAQAWTLESYIYNYPLVFFARYRALQMLQGDPVTRRKAPWGQWMHRNAPVTPEVTGAPQTDTLYSSLWLDVSAEPMVVVVPKIEQRYWSVQFSDLMATTFGLLNRRNFAGGHVLVTGPGWKGQVPSGMHHLPCALNQSFNLLRLFFANAADLPRAIAIQEQFQAIPLSLWIQGQRSFAGTDSSAVFRPTPAKDDTLADFKAITQMYRENQPSDIDPGMRRRMERLGLFQPEGFSALPPMIRAALEKGEAKGRQMVTQASLSLPGVRTRTGWVGPRQSIGYYNDGDRMYRASVTLAGVVAVPAAENPYYVLQRDPTHGEFLHGDHRYVLRFEKDMIPQADAFWSIHAYNQKYMVIPNAINRYSIGDRSAGLEYGSDGSLTIYIQAEAPQGSASANWLPVKKGEPFWLIIRAYEPRGPMRDLRWEGPALQRLA